jgi:hypothetical protein
MERMVPLASESAALESAFLSEGSAKAPQLAALCSDRLALIHIAVGGAFRGRELVPGVNTGFVEGQPNVRRDGLELFFFSNRPGSLGNDIYSASRASTADGWSTPVNLGPAVNGVTASSETRPSLSWDGTTLFFGSNRAGSEGDADHYVTTREKVARSSR